MSKMSFGRYDIATCMTFATYAVCSMAIPMCLVPLALSLRFPLDDGGMGLGGALQLGRSIPMVGAMVLCGFAGAKWGKRRTLGFSVLLMSAGIMAASASPGYGFLLLALAVAGLGEGVIEGLATPYIQDLHPDQPGRYLNFSHSFWSVGVLVLVLGAGGALSLGVSWRLVIFLAGALSVIPALIFLLPSRRATRETHVQTDSWRELTRRSVAIMRTGRFWQFFAAMFFAGGGEFCLTFWCASFIQIEFAGSAWVAGAGTACFAAGMFLGRIWSGLYVHQHNLKKLIVISALVSVILTLPFPFLFSKWALFPLLLLAGVVAGPFWPSIQSDGAHRIRGDHTMMMILFSCAGVPGSGFFSMLLGVLGDTVGLRLSFLVVPACFLMVFLLMGHDLLVETREAARPGGKGRPSARLA